ncbi:reverse transcriptase domain-containing protein [Artemisia annua]|uniref:Reverse transcriptase domain-containing protein n=1 Tax=Artemisia annua TaxID=35608 RepID=A0A2U1L2M3_ARTAN|nr:reverse transcriptase domain-containing protein [Artemisia annua]
MRVIGGANYPGVSALKRTYDCVSLMDKDGLGAGKKMFDTGTPRVVLFKDDKVVKGVEEPVQSALVSFASLVGAASITRKANFRPFDTRNPSNDKVGVQIPISFVLEVSSSFDKGLFGYFIGKRVPFSVFENYVRNAWKKYGIVCAMMKK